MPLKQCFNYLIKGRLGETGGWLNIGNKLTENADV